MEKKKYKPQQDRFLSHLTPLEKAYQKRLRTLIVNENLLSIA